VLLPPHSRTFLLFFILACDDGASVFMPNSCLLQQRCGTPSPPHYIIGEPTWWHWLFHVPHVTVLLAGVLCSWLCWRGRSMAAAWLVHYLCL